MEYHTVVVGSGGVQRFLRGSVSARVAANVPMSVLIVHGPGAARTGGPGRATS